MEREGEREEKEKEEKYSWSDMASNSLEWRGFELAGVRCGIDVAAVFLYC